MSSPFRDVELIKRILKVLDRTVTDLMDLLKEVKNEEKDEAYKVNISEKKL